MATSSETCQECGHAASEHVAAVDGVHCIAPKVVNGISSYDGPLCGCGNLWTAEDAQAAGEASRGH